MRRFGLIGKHLSHSFSPAYFSQKFQDLGLAGYSYQNFELDHISEISDVLNIEGLAGLNVTIPYKTDVIQYLDEVDDLASKVGAVNTIKISDGKAKGYNTDVVGFKNSLRQFIGDIKLKALVLGSGGASKAICVALEMLNIKYQLVSRTASEHAISYEEANRHLIEYRLIINTTPLGMHPEVDQAPYINYNLLSAEHFLYDLIYNPVQTNFLKLGKEQGALIKNGLDMLHIQAEESFIIWES